MGKFKNTANSQYVTSTLKSKQTGAVLITSIMLLIVFTLLGVATMRTNITDITIQTGIKNRGNAFQCAEAAIRAGELWLGQLSGAAYEVATAPDQSKNQVWNVNNPLLQNPETEIVDLWGDSTLTWKYGGGLLNAAANLGCKDDPLYFIEFLGGVASDSESLDIARRVKSKDVMYRITAYSIGVDDNATSVLQSTYLQPVN